MTAHRPARGLAVTGTVEAVFDVAGRGLIVIVRTDAALDDCSQWVGGYVENGTVRFPTVGLPISSQLSGALNLLVQAAEGAIAVGEAVTVVPRQD